MSSTPDRGPITQWLINRLEAESFRADGMVPPSDAGWQDDMVGDGSEFEPYIVVTPQTSSAGEGSLGDSTFDWEIPYTINSYGVHLRQVEDLADDSRRFLTGLRRININMKDGSSWKVIGIRCTAIGGIGLNQSINPHAYSQSDSLIIKVSRNLS